MEDTTIRPLVNRKNDFAPSSSCQPRTYEPEDRIALWKSALVLFVVLFSLLFLARLSYERISGLDSAEEEMSIVSEK